MKRRIVSNEDERDDDVYAGGSKKKDIVGLDPKKERGDYGDASLSLMFTYKNNHD